MSLEERRNRERRKPMNMGVYYDIVAGTLYLFLAGFIYKSPPQAVSAEVIQIIMVVFGLYGFFRIGRGIYKAVQRNKQ